MSTLVTGAGGFVGGALARRLLGQGETVVALLRDSHGFRPVAFDGDLHTAFGSVEDNGLIYRLLVDYGVTRVFHLAAQSTVPACQRDPVSAFRSNAMGTLGVLEAVRRSGRSIRVVCAETDKVYGSGTVPYREDQILLGTEPYPASKVAAAVIIRCYAHTYGLKISSVRSCNVYGPGDAEFSRLIPGSIRRMLGGEPAILYNHADRMLREFIYIDDEVDAYLTVATCGEAGEAYNVASSGGVRVGDVIRLLAEICGGKVEVRESDAKEIEIQYLDGSKLEALGFVPKIGLEAGLHKTVEWYRSRFGVTV